MSDYQAGFHLNREELAAIVSLGGKKNYYGFQMEGITGQDIWDACCRLMEDGLMTQINGSYRLCRELYDMMIPIRDAGTVLVLTPGSPEHSQVIYYGAERITSVQPVPYGGFSLSLFDGETLASNICAHVDLQPAREPARQSQSPEVPEVTPQMDAQTLSRGSLFLLERVDAGTGERLGWIRVFEQALDQWVQWTQNNEIQCQMLTGQLLEQLLERQWKGVGI